MGKTMNYKCKIMVLDETDMIKYDSKAMFAEAIGVTRQSVDEALILRKNRVKGHEFMEIPRDICEEFFE